jgi:CDP-glucose 4,6-dehydratase
MLDLKFFQNKRIFLTGHSGFKGSWMSLWLSQLGSEVCGYSLMPEKESLFNILKIDKVIKKSIFADIRNKKELEQELIDFSPDIVIHMAAQPLVRASYADSVYNFETNVMGVVNLFESILKCKSVKAVLNITTDKCYENREIDYNYKEGDGLGGYDPYSASKACSEIITSCYRRSFFEAKGVNVASVRAGNVIGGGDFSVDRIIPDIFRAIRAKNSVEIRSPRSIRPWQHVLEPLCGYLMIVNKLCQSDGEKYALAYNFGPDKEAEVDVESLVKKIIEHMGFGDYKINLDNNLHEAKMLKLDNSFVKKEIGWKPNLLFDEAVSWTAEWYKKYFLNESVKSFTLAQIRDFEKLIK